MYLIVGLGNPAYADNGIYRYNRHNVGFLFLDFLSKNKEFIRKSSFLSFEIKLSSNILIKPDTYMNLSGKAVAKYMQFYKQKCENIIIIHDDIDLKFASLRYKIAGGAGGHNGLKSCDENIGNDYFRIRMGIGRNNNMQVSDYVLSDFSDDELEILNNDVFPKASKALFAYMDEVSLSDIQRDFSLKGNV